MSGRGGPPKTSPIHLPGVRTEFIGYLQAGMTFELAAEAIGCHHKTVTRYMERDPEFAATARAAREDYRAERAGPKVPPPRPPMSLKRVVHDGIPIDQPRDMPGGPTYEEFQNALRDDLNNPEAKGHCVALQICDRYFHGPILIAKLRQAEREAELLHPEEKPSVMVIRLPERSTSADG